MGQGTEERTRTSFEIRRGCVSWSELVRQFLNFDVGREEVFYEPLKREGPASVPELMLAEKGPTSS